MGTSTNAKNLSTRATLRKKDAASTLEQPNGTLNLSGDTISFLPDSGQDGFSIKLSEITDADMTNIFAKDQMIFTTTQEVKHIVSFAPGLMLVNKKTLKYFLIPGGLNYFGFNQMTDSNQVAQAWKKALVDLLPANVVRQRIEVHWVRTAAIGLLISLALIGILAAVIVYFHLKSLR